MATLKSIKNKYLIASHGDALGVGDNASNVALLAFRIAAADSIAKFDMRDGMFDTFTDATGVDAGNSTNETRDSTGKYYSGSSSVSATGGTITTSGGYRIHSFTADGTFTVGSGTGNVEYLIVAAGGGGGGRIGGGGGAGGFRTNVSGATSGGGGSTEATMSLTAQAYSITVGEGGAGGTSNNHDSSNTAYSGEDSVFNSITSVGGGAGAGSIGNRAGVSGGSGGGSHATGGPAAGTANQGYAGGAFGGGYTGSGGGGGASAVGTDGNGNAGPGGAGVASSITGSSVTYAGGGGGGLWTGGSRGNGGSGGGGNGAPASSGAKGGAGTDGLGGGGGAGSYDGSPNAGGGDGGNGIVIIRYVDATGFSTYNNLTLVSNATTALAQPDLGDIVTTYTNGAGTATINTDLKAWVSRDGGTTYTQGTLVSEGTTGSDTVLTSRGIDISGQPAGTSMRYKITTHNQSASKVTRIQAASLAWG